MSYCVNCGVKLADYHKKCPLCDTVVLNPNRETSAVNTDYPNYRIKPLSEKKRIRRIMTGIILLAQFLVYSMVTVFIDILVTGIVTWSLIVVLSLVLLTVTVAIPFFKKSNTFFRLFTGDCLAVVVYLLLLNLVLSGKITWASYTSVSILLGWVIVSGIFLTNRIQRFLPITLYYVFTMLIMAVITSFFVTNQYITLKIMASIGIVFLVMSLISYFVIKAKVNRIYGLLAMLLIDVSILSLAVDLTIHYYFFDAIKVTWSLIVNAVALPMVTTLYAARRSSEIREMISKKLHK